MRCCRCPSRVKAVYEYQRASRRIVGVFRLAAGRASAVEFIIQASPGCALRRRSTSLALLTQCTMHQNLCRNEGVMKYKTACCAVDLLPGPVAAERGTPIPHVSSLDRYQHSPQNCSIRMLRVYQVSLLTLRSAFTSRSPHFPVGAQACYLVERSDPVLAGWWLPRGDVSLTRHHIVTCPSSQWCIRSH